MLGSKQERWRRSGWIDPSEFCSVGLKKKLSFGITASHSNGRLSECYIHGNYRWPPISDFDLVRLT